jgi:hypothetical protein
MAQPFAAGGLMDSGRRADHAASGLVRVPRGRDSDSKFPSKQSGSLACVDTFDVITRSERD